MKTKPVIKLDKIPKFETLISISQRFPEADPKALHTFLVQTKVWGDVISAMDVHFARHNMSRGKFVVLITLYHNTDQDISPAMIAEKTGVTRATITGLLDGLEKDGMIVRKQDPGDRRALTIHLTAKAKRMLEKMLPDHYRRITAFMAMLDDREKEQLTALLSKVSLGIPALREP